MPRTLLPLLVLAVAVTALAGCTAPASETASTGSPVVETPAAEDCAATGEGTGEIVLLVVEGGFDGGDYDIADISPVYAQITTTQRSVRIPGDDGPVALPGSTVTADYAIFDGTTGAQIVTTIGATPEEFVLDDAELPVGIVSVLQCSTPNTRVAGIIPVSEGFQTAPTGFPTGVPLIFVADVRSVTD